MPDLDGAVQLQLSDDWGQQLPNLPTVRVTVGATEALAVLLPHAVLAIRLSGVLTLATMRTLRAQVGQHMAEGTKVYVVDYRSAVCMMTAAELDESVRDAYRAVPGAVIISPDRVKAFSQSAYRTARWGVVRRIFAEAPPALSWAVRLARLAPD